MSDELNIDIDHEMYLKFEDYRYNAIAEGARPMGYSAWAESAMAQNYKMLLEARELAPAQPATADAGALVASDFDELLTNLSGQLNSTAISILRTYFAGEHAMRTRAEAKLAAAEARADAALAFYALMVNIDVLGDIADDLANDETWEVWGELAHLREVLGDGLQANG